MKRALTRHVPFFVTMLTAALIVVGWGVASAGPCIPDGQTCRTDQSCCGGVCVKSSKKSFGTCCTPTTCAAEGANCGMIADGCGGALDCGTCTFPQTCGGGGTPNVCGLAPLTGNWVLTGELVEPGCRPGLVETQLSITQVGSSLRAFGLAEPPPANEYLGGVRTDGTWAMSNAFPDVGRCPTGEPVEIVHSITGTLPDTDGVATVAQVIQFVSISGPIFFPCPQCTVRWRGTMVRQ